MGIAFTACLSAFLHHVWRVVAKRTKEQVMRINASWIVPAWAIVQHAHSIGNSAEMEFPGEAMCAYRESGLTSGDSVHSPIGSRNLAKASTLHQCQA